MSDARESPTQPPPLPACLADRLAGGRWWRDTVGEAGCAVYRIAGTDAGDLYLKHGTGDHADDVIDEAARLAWLAPRLPTPTPQWSVAGDGAAWLLTSALPGRTAWQVMTEEPARAPEIVALLARFLARLHALPAEQCPFNAAHPLRLAHARRRMAAGLVDTEDFDDARAGWTAERAWDAMVVYLPLAPDPVVTHGDYSLDNILIDGDGVAGCIDLGRAGVADRYQDIAILLNCLDEFDGDLRGVFGRAYGLATFDPDKLAFHLLLDEFF